MNLNCYWKKVAVIYLLFLSYFTYCEDLPIVNLTVGKSLSLGNEIAVVNNNTLNTITNPAMLGVIKTPYILQTGRLVYYAGTTYDFLGIVGSDIAQGVVLGLLIDRFSSGVIDIRDIDGVPTGETTEYKVTNANIGISAQLYPKLWLGISVAGFWEKSNVETKFFAGSCGIVYDYLISNKIIKSIRLGTVVKGFGVNKNIVHHEGVSLIVGPTEIVLGCENNTVDVYNNKIKFGININILGSQNTDRNFCLSFGTSRGFNGNYLLNYGVGIGIKFDWFMLDYSYNQHDFLGVTHNIMLGIPITSF